MRVGVLSDTHNEIELARQAIELLCREGAQSAVHCGDLTGIEIVAACAALPCYKDVACCLAANRSDKQLSCPCGYGG